MTVLVRHLQRKEFRSEDRLACYGTKAMFMKCVGIRTMALAFEATMFCGLWNRLSM
jgi:hypothetical protein